ncbi:hypothetical protein JCM31826_21180 [Thermaurantimonas aggregans]|uniref:Outer membrane protein beta-barrel domain-containing protein n=1 Tax=Thermaurantimonas aggregans TaxID=2173829 RepID=A0A401XNP1_9FLAO|nr:DUF6268 family outer membrane beta-barrel protein [Thermaurantimonas aggregans]MCX8147678.1 DUF6268 family outer membrane beta-barrel protein [Thermaurantimonas aggregans]GCD78636.1 hypothetical protein JCM31826_21180 [Thermaurantimonas aggregans]
MAKRLTHWTLLLYLAVLPMMAQVITETKEDEEEDEEDYGQVEYLGKPTKTYANARIFGMSPQRFVSLGWDVQLPYEMRFTELGTYATDSTNLNYEAEKGLATYTGGFRLQLMAPIISNNRFLWQSMLNVWDVQYTARKRSFENWRDSLMHLTDTLHQYGLKTSNWINTFYVPFDEKNFIIAQLQLDLSGNYDWLNPLEGQLLYSGAILYGQRPNDRKQWAVGISRTYRAGGMNYIPLLLYNWTSLSRKWGIEFLLPARGHGRYTFNPRSMVLFGYELEGSSYRIRQFSNDDVNFLIRRGELRFRLDYQRQISGFWWLGLQAGYRVMYSFDGDRLEKGQPDFFNLLRTHPYAMRNQTDGAFYFNISINYVSP